MSVYLPLFKITVEHTYTKDGLCHDLEFIPAVWTDQLIRKNGLLLRTTMSGLTVFYDEERADPRELFEIEQDVAGAFCWKIFVRNHLFLNFTSLPVRPNAILHFDSAGAESENAATAYLHAAQGVSEDDLEYMTSPVFAGLFNVRDKCRPPNFCVTIRDHKQPPAQEGKTGGCPDWRIRFKARETIWKYYIVGDMVRNEPYIFDKAGAIAFHFDGMVSLGDGRTAKVFVSERPLSLQEISDCNFQLREKGAGAGKIIIKRLPVASAQHIGGDGMKRGAVSDIFINC